jgi:glycosyltransferase involved in cell wall biosynthesis
VTVPDPRPDPRPDRQLHAVLPGSVDDPATPSGGNRYDRRALAALDGLGWRVHAHLVPGGWPRPDAAALAGLDRALSGLPDGSVVLVDGLVGCAAPQVLVPAAARLRVAVLVHLPLADETGLDPTEAAELDRRERQVLAAAGAVVVTSRWAAERLPGAADVAEPGVDRAPTATGGDGSELLCVASLTRRKAQDVLVTALAELADREFRCVLAGPAPDPAFAAELAALVERAGLADRVVLAGPLHGPDLDAAYARADLAVLVSWAETYGMTVTEALARGLPVVVSDAGPLPDTLGRAPDGSRPGVVVPAGQPGPLAAALRRWFDQPGLRAELRRSARSRRCILSGWEDTGRRLHEVLEALRLRPVGVPR